MTPVKNVVTQILPKEGQLPSGQENLGIDAAAGTEFAQALAEFDNLEDSLESEVMPDADELVMASGLSLALAPLSTEPLVDTLEVAPGPLTTEPTPKVMDPKLIQQVNEAVLFDGVEQVQVPQQLQLKDLLLQQTPAPMPRSPGRAPAIDFAQTQMDPQLMNFEDFVAQKNAVTGKSVNPKAYGMPAKTSLHVDPLSGEKAIAGVQTQNPQAFDAGAGQPQLMPTFPLAEAPPGLARLESTPRVFDMQQLQQHKNVDAETILNQVADYIVQAKAAKEPTVNMRVQHQELGMLDITVNRTPNDMVSIAIGTQDVSSKLFLGQHRESLMNHLAHAGVDVSDLRMEQSSSSSSNSKENMSQSSQQGFQGSGREFGSQENQRRQEQERRQELWDLLREKEVA